MPATLAAVSSVAAGLARLSADCRVAGGGNRCASCLFNSSDSGTASPGRTVTVAESGIAPGTQVPLHTCKATSNGSLSVPTGASGRITTSKDQLNLALCSKYCLPSDSLVKGAGGCSSMGPNGCKPGALVITNLETARPCWFSVFLVME